MTEDNKKVEDKIEELRKEKEIALKAKDFERAARLRDEERKLCEALGRDCKNSPGAGISNKEMVRSALIVSLLLSLSAGYFLYKLFVKKVMWCWWVGDVKVSCSDPLFWIYAAALIAPVVVFILLMCATFANRKTKNDGLPKQ